MSLDWANERYARAYTRDTAEMLCWPWQGRAIWWLLIRKADRSGLLPVPAKLGVRGLAALISMPVEVVEVGLAALLEDGCLRAVLDGYLIPNFIEAQETPASDAKRQRDLRERRRAGATIENHDAEHHGEERTVTDRHVKSRDVTPNRTDPILAKPNHPDFLVGSPRAHDPTVPVPEPAPAPPPGVPSQLGLLLGHAIRRLDAARRELDPEARPIGSAITLAPADRDKLLGKLRATDERERAATLDHCLDVLIAAATAKGDVGMLRVGMLAGESSWDQWRLGTVASVRGQHAARASPAPRATQPLRGAAAARAETARLVALEALEEQEKP